MPERGFGNGVLDEIRSTGRVWSRPGETLRVTGQVAEDEGRLLQRLIREVGARRTLEIGLRYGISALYICEALAGVRDARHEAIDPSQHRTTQYGGTWHGIGVSNLGRAGYEHVVKLYEEPSHRVPPRLLAEQWEFDLVFIDGWHTFDHVLLDFFYSDLLLRSGGVVVFDDTDREVIRAVCRFLVRNHPYTLCASTPTSQPPGVHLDHFARDAALGSDPTAACMASRKDRDDDRGWWFRVQC